MLIPSYEHTGLFNADGWVERGKVKVLAVAIATELLRKPSQLRLGYSSPNNLHRPPPELQN